MHIALEIDCGSLDDPANGDVSVSSTTFNSMATYSCNTGYTLTGDDMRMCTESSRWSGSEPTCAGIHCTHTYLGLLLVSVYIVYV